MKFAVMMFISTLVVTAGLSADGTMTNSSSSMNGGNPGTSGPSSTMNGPAMVGPTMNGPTMQGSAPEMTGPNGTESSGSMNPNAMTGPNTMQAQNAMEADPKVGHELRYAPSAAHKVIFSTLKRAESYAANGPAVLFFAADWCPYCQADLRDINEHGSMLAKDITVIVVNYDTSASLKAKYGVTVQDTFVQINSMGQKLAVWNGGGVAALNKNVKRG